jgi:hypothetical protein
MFRSNLSIGTGTQNAMQGAVCVDYEVAVYHISADEKDTPAHLCFHEVGGRRRFWVSVDCLGWSALLTQIQTRCDAEMPVGRAGRIRRPEGQLQAVIVDKIDEVNRRFHAKLRVAKDGDMVSVDVRPSDAFILAATDDVPIFIDEKVLEIVADKRENAGGTD